MESKLNCRSYKKTNNIVISALSVLVISIVTFTTNIGVANSGLDMSGMYLLNALENLNVKFGRDIYFTYGPLGFLEIPMNISQNASVALVIGFLLMTIEIILLWDSFRRLHWKNNILLMLVETAVVVAFSPWMSYDYQLCFLVFLSVSLAWTEPHRYRYIIIASALTVFSALVKVNSGVQCAMTIGLLIIMKLIHEGKSALKYLCVIPGIAFAYFLAFMIYNPSIKYFFQYIRDTLELTAGFSSAMSLQPAVNHLRAAIFCIITFAVVWLLVLVMSPKNGMYLTVFIGALFQFYKHGFVRADGHIYNFFMGFLMIISVAVLFIDYNDFAAEDPMRKTVARRINFIIGLTAIASLMCLYIINPSVQSLYNTFTSRIESIKRNYFYRSDTVAVESTEDVIPQELLDCIGDKSVAVLPWELSVDVYNDINMVVMPATQLYSAYTEELDLKNAEFFSGEKAPDYILYSHNSIDNRIPLLEAPATWNSIYENYDSKLIEGQWLLLEKKSSAEPILLGEVRKEEISKTETYYVPESDNGVFVRIDSDLSLLGSIRSLFYQIPPVDMTIRFDDGTQWTGRVLPDVLKNGFVIDELPHSLLSVGMTINGQPDGKRVESFQFGGAGWKYYKDDVEIYLQEVTNERNMVSADLRDDIRLFKVSDPTEGKTQSQQEQLVCVDYLNDTLGVKPITEAYKKIGLQINGWAIDETLLRDADGVFIKLGETFYECKKTDREDVCLAILGNSEFPMVGFEGWIELNEYQPGEYPLSIIMIVNNGTEYYETSISTVSVE